MPKRKYEESKEERWARKMKKYEAKLQRHPSRPRRRIIYSSDESDVQQEEHLEFDAMNQVAPNDGPNASEASQEVEVPTESRPDVGDPVIEAPETEVPTVEVPIVVESSSADEYDVTLLQSLGENEIETNEFGNDIHPEIALRLKNVLISGLTKETRDDLLKKYLFPKNLPNTKAPMLKPEIEAMMVETTRLRDKRLFTKQDQLGRILSALAISMTELLKKNPDVTVVLRTLNDAAKLLADSHYAETDTRRSVILPLIDKSLTEAFKNKKRDNLLFGESLSESVKVSQGIKKTSQLIQAPKNFKGPSSSIRIRQQQRAGQTYPQSRAGGGQRATTSAYGNRRRAGAPSAQSYHPPHPSSVPHRRTTAAAPAPPARRQTQPSTQRPAHDRQR